MIERERSIGRRCETGQSFASRAMVWAGLASLVFAGNALAQSAAAGAGVCDLHGRVFDAGHHARAGVTVALSGDRSGPLERKTDATGEFTFTGLRVGKYQLHAEEADVGVVEESVEVSVATGSKEMDLTLTKAVGVAGGDAMDGQGKTSADRMEFSDQPNFTVAGITDWTAVGGHGSDSILRTSETLARDAQGLKAGPGGGMKSLPADQERELIAIRAEESKGDVAGARLHVKAMLARQPSAELYGVAGELDEKLGDPLEAVREFEQATKFDPSEQNYFAWGSELLLHRAVWQAQEVFERGLKAYPRSARMETALGTALFAEARYEEAARRLCAAADLDAGSVEPYLFMGRIGMVTPVSVPCLEEKLGRFVREQPANSEASYLYAMTILKRQEQKPDAAAVAQAEGLLASAVEHDPKCADGYLQLGILQASRRSFEKAMDFYAKAIEANPQLADAHYRLGVAYDRTGKRDKAEAEFRVHDELVKRQTEAVEAQRREVKQFLVVLNGQPALSATP